MTKYKVLYCCLGEVYVYKDAGKDYVTGILEIGTRELTFTVV